MKGLPAPDGTRSPLRLIKKSVGTVTLESAM